MRLHLPLPVRRSFLPEAVLESSRIVSAPFLAAKIAAVSPAGPAPIMQISVFTALIPFWTKAWQI